MFVHMAYINMQDQIAIFIRAQRMALSLLINTTILICTSDEEWRYEAQ